MTEDEIRTTMDEYRAKQQTCQHRWEQTFFGQKYWEPGTWQFQCHRCGKTNMVTLGVDYAA